MKLVCLACGHVCKNEKLLDHYMTYHPLLYMEAMRDAESYRKQINRQAEGVREVRSTVSSAAA